MRRAACGVRRAAVGPSLPRSGFLGQGFAADERLWSALRASRRGSQLKPGSLGTAKNAWNTYIGEAMPKESVMRGVQFLVDDDGERTAVLIDLKKNAQLWEDFYDVAVAKSRAKEPRESLESVRRRLRARGKR